MQEVYLSLIDAAEFEKSSYEAMKKRVQRNRDNLDIRLENAQNDGGKPRVLISLSSLSAKAQRAYQKTQQSVGGEALMQARPPDQEPWYLDVDIHWYIENHKEQYYRAVELGNQIQQFVEYDDGDRTLHAVEYALQLDMSVRTLYRHAEKYQEAAAWALRLELENGHNYDYLKVLALCRKPKDSGTFPSLPPEQRALIENIWFDRRFAANLGTIEMLYDQFEGIAYQKGWKYPSYQTVARYINHIMVEKGYGNAHYLQTKGLREYKRNKMVKGLRDTSGVPVMGIIQGDAHTFDFWVKYTDPKNGKVSAIRPTMVAWIDTRSRRVMGAVMAKNINGQIVKHSLLKVAYTVGVPECILIDNGKEFTGQDITGRNRKDRSDYHLGDMLDTQAKGFLKSLGVKTDYRSLPYQPWGKGPIERVFSTFCNQFSKWMTSYTGTLTGSRTFAKVEKDIDKMLEKDLLLTLEECYELFDVYLEKYHHKKHRGLTRMKEQWTTPWDLFENAAERYVRPAPPLEYAEMLLMKAERARVYTTGINRFGECYMAYELNDYIGSHVNIRWNPENLNNIIVYTLDGKRICEAPRQQLLKYNGYATQDEIEGHMRKKNAQLAADRERVRKAIMSFEERNHQIPAAGKLDYMAENKNPQPVVALPEDKQFREEMKAKKSGRKNSTVNNFFDKKADEALEKLRKLG